MRDESEGLDDVFDWSAQLAILRRAVAGLVILADLPNTTPGALARDMGRFCGLSEVTLATLSSSDWIEQSPELRHACASALSTVVEVRRRLEELPVRSRPAVEAVRRRLYSALATLSERLTAEAPPLRGFDATQTELDRALALRHLVSDFHGAIMAVARGRANMSWALTVAEAELSISIREQAFLAGPDRQKAELLALRSRLARRRGKPPSSAAKAALHADVFGSSEVLASLSTRSDVKRHDARALAMLALVLARGHFSLTVAASAADALAALRGMDLVLDRLMVELPFDPVRALTLISRRVAELRTRALAS